MRLFSYIVVFLASILLTWGILPQVIRLCYNNDILDHPNERKVHVNKIPRLGGVVFLPVILISLAVYSVCFKHIEDIPTTSNVLLVLLGVVLLYGIGIIDDTCEMGAKTKFLFQTIAAIFIALGGNVIYDFTGLCVLQEISIVVNILATIFFVLIIVNALNLIDGIDGLASLLSLIALIVFSCVFHFHQSTFHVLVCLSAIGTLGVYSYYNVFGKVEHKSKTHMGDTGSMVIGYILAYLILCHHNIEIPKSSLDVCCMAITPLTIPIFDMIRVAITRLSQGKGMFTADKQHIHHLCMAKGMTMHKTLICILAIQVLISIVNYTLLFFNAHFIIITIIDLVIYALFILQQKR